MKKWQEFLLCGVCIVLVDVVFEFIKSLVENGSLNIWTFAVVALAMLVAGWMGVFVGAKSLKNKKTVKNSSWIVGFIYCVIIWSVYMVFDLMKYSLENNILNTYYFFGIGIALMFIGWGTGRLDGMLPKPKKKRN